MAGNFIGGCDCCGARGGFKNEHASKVGHGRPGFLDGTRYLNQSIRVSFDRELRYDTGSGPQSFRTSGAIELDIAVGQRSGNIAVSNCVETWSTQAISICEIFEYIDLVGLRQLGTIDYDSANGWTYCGGPIGNDAALEDFVEDLTGGGGTLTTSIADNEISFEYSIPTTSPPSSTPPYCEFGEIGSTGNGLVLSVTITLSEIYDWADVWTDVLLCIGQWDLTDDTEYPWRMDDNVAEAPYVHFDESPTVVKPTDALTGYDGSASWCAISGSGSWTGAMIGGPGTSERTPTEWVTRFGKWRGAWTWMMPLANTGRTEYPVIDPIAGAVGHGTVWVQAWAEYLYFNKPAHDWGSGTVARGNYDLVKWTYDFSEAYDDSGDPDYRKNTGALKTVQCVQEQVSWSPLTPAYVLIHPDAAGSQPWIYFELPEPAMDKTYGSKLIWDVQQWMADPLWDPTDIYTLASRPYEECECTPSGTLPSDTYWTTPDGRLDDWIARKNAQDPMTNCPFPGDANYTDPEGAPPHDPYASLPEGRVVRHTWGVLPWRT